MDKDHPSESDRIEEAKLSKLLHALDEDVALPTDELLKQVMEKGAAMLDLQDKPAKTDIDQTVCIDEEKLIKKPQRSAAEGPQNTCKNEFPFEVR